MNYLSHYVFNHQVCGLPAEAHFALAVALPDLWLRFSRKRRIRWKVVRAAQPTEAVDQALRAGLLNHVEIDRRFHVLPLFLQWQARLKAAVNSDGTHPALVDFLAHISLELMLDRQLMVAQPGLVDEFFDLLATCDAQEVARRVGVLGAVDTTGLACIIDFFTSRRFLRHYRTHGGLTDAIRMVLIFAEIPPPADRLLDELVVRAADLADPAAVWNALSAGL